MKNLYYDEFYDEDGKLTKKVNDVAEKEVVYWNNRIKIRKENLKDSRKIKRTVESRRIFQAKWDRIW